MTVKIPQEKYLCPFHDRLLTCHSLCYYWSMNKDLYAGYPHILSFLPPEMLQTSESQGSALAEKVTAFLTRSAPGDLLFLNQLDDCLGLAYRKAIVNNDLRSRLLSKDHEAFESAFAELKVAKFIESLGNEVEFHPSGREGKKLDFEAVGRQQRTLVEVKTIFGSPQERSERRTLSKLWYSALEVRVPLHLNFRSFTPAKDFRKRDFQHWLKREAQQMVDSGKQHSRFQYINNRGFSVTIDATTASRMSLMATSAEEPIWLDKKIAREVSTAIQQLPQGGTPCLLVINDQRDYALFEEEIRAILYGKMYVGSEFPLPNRIWAVFSKNQNTRVSAVGIFYTATKFDLIQEGLEIYHNPYASQVIDVTMLGSKIVNHYAIDKNALRIRRL